MGNEDGLQGLRSSLEADGYQIEVSRNGDRVGVTISATPEACAECLVPKPLMLSALQQALGVPEADIDLTYPGETGSGAETGSGSPRS